MLNQAKLRAVVFIPQSIKSTLSGWNTALIVRITAQLGGRLDMKTLIAYAPSAPERINSGSKQ